MTATTGNIYGDDGQFTDFSTWFTTVGEFIEDEEDEELAAVQMQKISTYINAYQQALQNQLNIFNKNNSEYLAGVQRNLEQAKISMSDAQKTADLALQGAIADYQNELQRVSVDAQKYGALVNAEIQTYTQQLQEKTKEYEWKFIRMSELKKQYAEAFIVMAPKQQAQAGGRR